MPQTVDLGLWEDVFIRGTKMVSISRPDVTKSERPGNSSPRVTAKIPLAHEITQKSRVNVPRSVDLGPLPWLRTKDQFDEYLDLVAMYVFVGRPIKEATEMADEMMAFLWHQSNGSLN